MKSRCIFLLGFLIVLSFCVWFLFSFNHSKSYDISGSFGLMNGNQQEKVPMPPYLNGKELAQAFNKFLDPKDSRFHTSISSEWIYFFSLEIDGVDYRVFLNNEAMILNENQDSAEARKIRQLLFYAMGQAWVTQKFNKQINNVMEK